MLGDRQLFHNCLWNKNRLWKIGMSEDARCDVCKKEAESTMHMFFECDQLKCLHMNLKVFCKLKKNKTHDSKVWKLMFLFGAKGNKKKSFALNFFLSVARYSVWLRRNLMKQKGGDINICKIYEQQIAK